MVMTSDRKGIECDLCGAEHREQFSYFSAKSVNPIQVDKIDVNVEQSDPIIGVDKRYLDIDICIKCMEDIVNKMKKVISDRQNKQAKNQKNKSNQWSSDDGSVRSKRSKNKR